MNLDEQLPSLLAREAEHADVAPPTRQGVETVIGRRAHRRRRWRTSLTGVAAVCVLAGAVGGFALGGGGSDPARSVDSSPGQLAEVPLLGVDLPGWELNFAGKDDGFLGDDSGSPPAATYAIFVRGTDAFGAPSIWVTIGPADLLDTEEGLTPVDLDGDGSADGESDGWRLASPNDPPTIAFTRGTTDTVATTGFGVPEPELITYTSALREAGSFTVDEVPTPDGFVLDALTALPNPDVQFAATSYRLASGGSVDITVTNQPGWSTLASHDGSSSPPTSYEEVPLGDSLLGPGAAVLTTTRSPSPSGLILTDSGLTIELVSESAAYDHDLIRRLITDAPFIEVQPTDDPAESPPSPAAPTPTTTPTTTSIAGGTSTVTGFTIEPNRITIEFEGPAPGVQILGLGSWDPRCEIADPSLADSPAGLFESFISREDEPPSFGGFINAAVSGRTPPVIPGPVVGPDGSIYLACDDGDGDDETSLVVFPMEEEPLSASPSVVEDPPRIVIDVQR